MSSTGCMGVQKKTRISFLQQLLHLYMKHFYLQWYVYDPFPWWVNALHSSDFLHMLILQAETLRDSFPASDKSLSRLLGEAPHLPNSVLKLLERLCCPGSSEKDEKELHSGDRVTQGLSTVWNLILMRPPMREACLRIALQVCFSVLCLICIFYLEQFYLFCSECHISASSLILLGQPSEQRTTIT